MPAVTHSRFIEGDVFSTIEQLEEAGSLSDPNHALRIEIAREYGLLSPPLLSTPLPTCPASPALLPPPRRRSVLAKKRPRESVVAQGTRPQPPPRTLSAPLVGLVRRVSLLNRSLSRTDAEVDSLPAYERRRSFDVTRTTRSRSPRPRSALYISAPASTVPSPPAARARPLSCVAEMRGPTGGDDVWLDFAKRAVQSPTATESGLALLRPPSPSRISEDRRSDHSVLARPLENCSFSTYYEYAAAAMDTPDLVRSRLDGMSISSVSDDAASSSSPVETADVLARTIRPGDGGKPLAVLGTLDANTLKPRAGQVPALHKVS